MGSSTGGTTYPSGCSRADIVLQNGQTWAGCDIVGTAYDTNICKAGYSIPTGGQWSKLIDTYPNNFIDLIRLTRDSSGAGYYYWTSTTSPNASEMLLLYVNTLGKPLINPGTKTNKINVRCIKDGSSSSENGQPNTAYTVIPKPPIPYNKQYRKVCEGATFEGEMKVQNFRWYDTDNKPQELITKCSQPKRENGGLICSERENGCCPTGKVAINGQCITPADVNTYCYADSGCKDGLQCNNNKCVPRTSGGGTFGNDFILGN
jgi:hypothetical protein